MRARAIRDRTCVIGVGNTDYGCFPETDSYGLGASALEMALDDAGLRPEDVDGLIVHRIPSYERFAEISGLDPRFGGWFGPLGRYSSVAVMAASMALVSGQATYVALVYGNDGRSRRERYGGGSGLWAPWGMTSPGASCAMAFRRHMKLYGTTSEHLAHVGVTFRRHASLNPSAVMRKEYTVADHQASRFVVEPLRLLDYCLINDGGVSLIMTTADRAKDAPNDPVYVSGFARKDTCSGRLGASYPPMEDFWYEALRAVSEEVHRSSGLSREDVDALMIYDNFSPTVLFSLEGMGYCPRGESGPFVAQGGLALGGRRPVNTSGGHLSESYMQGWGLLAEAVRQLRGECGARQVPGCSAVQYICATACASSILFRR